MVRRAPALVLVLLGCSGAPVDPLVELRARACPDGGCVTTACAPPPTDCPGGGTSWLRDAATGACCEYACWGFWGEGFSAFRTRAECEALPECNGSPVGTVLPSGDGCNTCTCEADGRWSCTEVQCDGSPVGRACGYWQGGCPASHYCAFVPSDTCSDTDQPSVCRPRPTSCAQVDAPACGCDGREYPSQCEAARAGRGIRTLGRCRLAPPCSSNDDCAPDELCASTFGERRCLKRPLGCVNELAPVCGKDAVAYGNPCLAAQAGVEVRHEGLCKPSCSGARDCAPDEYCSACSGGQCLPRPRPPFSCEVATPVCSCEGETLACAELAPHLGTAVAHPGACP